MAMYSDKAISRGDLAKLGLTPVEGQSWITSGDRVVPDVHGGSGQPVGVFRSVDRVLGLIEVDWQR